MGCDKLGVCRGQGLTALIDCSVLSREALAFVPRNSSKRRPHPTPVLLQNFTVNLLSPIDVLNVDDPNV